MKKIFLGFAFSLAILSFAQQYPNNGYGNDGYNNGYENNGNYGGDNYSNQNDPNNFPDDYYYNYPQDYYPTDYYQSYYNDYRKSIVDINWNVFFTQNRLNSWQVNQIVSLNNLYASFSTWNNFYRYNPDRWYYDRYYAMERILGPRVFVTFQNNYYHGSSPTVYFQNYRRTYYTPRYSVMPRYRSVNINIYRVDRAKFRRMDNPTLDIVRSQRENNGFRGSNRSSGGFRNQAGNDIKNNNSGGFRNNGNNGMRNENNSGGFRRNAENNGSTRSNGGFRGNNEVRKENSAQRQNNVGTRSTGGFRGNNETRTSAPRENSGFRQQRSENSAPRQQNNSRGSSGFRLTNN